MTETTVLPNFMIIGAPKAGTTTLFHYLAEHPQVAMGRIKEPNFFSFDADSPPPEDRASQRRYERSIKTIDEYRELFQHSNGAAAIGESSANYLANEGAAARIRRLLPDVKLIAILRNPADRAYSAYWMDVRKGYERRSFEESIRDWENQGESASRFITEGFYHEQLSRYRQHFDASQILVLLMDDLKRDALDVMRRVHRFLEIDENYVPDTSVRHNQGGVPKSALVERMLFAGWAKRLVPRPLVGPARKLVVNLRGINRKRPEKMTSQMRLHLGRIFQNDIRRLEGLLGRDLSEWLPQELNQKEIPCLIQGEE